MTYLFGNLKMYCTGGESQSLATGLLHIEIPEHVTAAVFPNTLHLTDMAKEMEGSRVHVGAQNVAWAPQGAYTGATSAHLMAEAGAQYALVGHSERRHIFGETIEATQQKIAACIDAGVVAVLCVGESKEERDAGQTDAVLRAQLEGALSGQTITADELIVAYEPVWAISKAGEGEPCSPQAAADQHKVIRSIVAELTGHEVPVVYGGSVDHENIQSYCEQAGIDGVLVGHASTTAQSWEQMIAAL